MKQPIAIGVENYKTIIENNYYYIDKTWMLKELADQKGTFLPVRDVSARP